MNHNKKKKRSKKPDDLETRERNEMKSALPCVSRRVFFAAAFLSLTSAAEFSNQLPLKTKMLRKRKKVLNTLLLFL